MWKLNGTTQTPCQRWQKSLLTETPTSSVNMDQRSVLEAPPAHTHWLSASAGRKGWSAKATRPVLKKKNKNSALHQPLRQTQQSTGLAASTRPPASPKTQNGPPFWAPFSVGMGPFGGLEGRNFDAGAKFRDPFLVWATFFFLEGETGSKKHQNVSMMHKYVFLRLILMIDGYRSSVLMRTSAHCKRTECNVKSVDCTMNCLKARYIQQPSLT